jgi:hypothetical protein
MNDPRLDNFDDRFDPRDPAMDRRAAMRLLGLGGLGALLGACVSSPPRSGGIKDPAPIYPPQVYQPTRVQPAAYPPPRPVYAPPSQPAPQPVPVARGIVVIPRSAWNTARPGRNLNAMNGISRVTVHHMGGDPVWATDTTATYATLTSILGGHRQRGWADIGYHYIIDRAGRVIEGRPVQYQGAHVSENNEHNLGIMLLGNFDQQSPSSAQVNAAHAFIRQMLAQHRVSTSRLYTHRELKPTACPGRSLQSHMITARNQRAFG